MKTFISLEEPFKALSDKFEVSPSTNGYQVAFSTERNGVYTLDPDAIVPAGQNLIYIGAIRWGYYKLVGNTSENLTVIL